MFIATQIIQMIGLICFSTASLANAGLVVFRFLMSLLNMKQLRYVLSR